MKQKKHDIQQVSQKNELIKAIKGTEYIKNPIVYSQIMGNMSIMQTNILIAVVSTLQDTINDRIVPGSGNGISSPIFSDEELKKGKVVFEFGLSQIVNDSRSYDGLEEACRSLQNLKFEYSYTKEDGSRVWRSDVLFGGIEIEKSGDRRTGEIRLEMTSDVANMLFNSGKRYVEHIRDIAKYCHSPRTPRLYIYLSAWRKTREYVMFSYKGILEFLGVIKYNKERTEFSFCDNNGGIRAEPLLYSRFKRDILEPARKELEKLAMEGRVDFYFDYEPIYSLGKKRGNPDQLQFHLIPSPSAEEVEKFKQEETRRKYADAWELFRADVREADAEFDRVFVSACRIEEEDGELFISCQTSFVAEKMNERSSLLEPLLKKRFGDRAIKYRI